MEGLLLVFAIIKVRSFVTKQSHHKNFVIIQEGKKVEEKILT